MSATLGSGCTTTRSIPDELYAMLQGSASASHSSGVVLKVYSRKSLGLLARLVIAKQFDFENATCRVAVCPHFFTACTEAQPFSVSHPVVAEDQHACVWRHADVIAFLRAGGTDWATLPAAGSARSCESDCGRRS